MPTSKLGLQSPSLRSLNLPFLSLLCSSLCRSSLCRSSLQKAVPLVLCVVGFAVAPAHILGLARAGWPGLLGPFRNGHADSKVVVPDQLPENPKIRWQLDAGQGYAGAAIRDGQVAMFQRDGKQDVIRLVSLADGKEIWSASFPAVYQQGIDSDKGPRCVPQIVDDAVLAYSAAGTLYCVSRSDGKRRWVRELRKEFAAEDGYFGAGSTPLVVDSSVIINVGGRKKGGVVAVRLSDGKNLWQSTDADASYASPILVAGAKPDQAGTVVVPTRYVTYGLEPKTGSVLWQIPFGQRGPTVNAATPIVCAPSQLFLTSSYGIGFVIARLPSDPMAPVSVEQKGDAISSQYATPVSFGTSVFGSDGREDGGWPSYKCMDSETGELLWSEAGMPICHSIALDGNTSSSNAEPTAGVERGNGEEAKPKILLIGINGKIWLLPATREGFRPLSKTVLPEGVYRALPALSENSLVVRTSGGSNATWTCFEW
ncbi:MAG: Pyrrolo-quinoline quinone [Planctomycetes bacterium]|nr:Pyrrolo-quinoline quinone [Planctomycetota bacterium]